jgi:membrane-associated HD superfamily phosphohydrolase
MRIVPILSAIAAISSGIIVLLGYFVSIEPLPDLRLLLTDWGIVIAGMAVLVGIFNLVAVQMEKIRTSQKSSAYGALLVLSLIITFGFGLLLGPDNPFMRMAVDAVIVPVEAALMAILAVTLIYASIRLFRRRMDAMSVLFLVAAILFMLAMMPTPFGPIPGNQFFLFVEGAVATGGARGLLIGIALGTLLTGLRVLFGVDRPYGDN